MSAATRRTPSFPYGFPLWNSLFPFPILPPFPIFKLLRKSRFLFMGDDLCSYDRSKKSGHTKKKVGKRGKVTEREFQRENQRKGENTRLLCQFFLLPLPMVVPLVCAKFAIYTNTAIERKICNVI